MAAICESEHIAGVRIAGLQTHGDARGRFTEVFRQEWFPQSDWSVLQWSRSESRGGTLRGLHYHHHQVDYWHCAVGEMRVGLADLRPSSPTHGATEMIALNQAHLSSVFIPIGVAHGFYAVTDAMLFYLVDNYYDGTDEWGVAWDDPALGLDWNTDGEPILSERDRRNPLVTDIPANQLPE